MMALTMDSDGFGSAALAWLQSLFMSIMCEIQLQNKGQSVYKVCSCCNSKNLDVKCEQGLVLLMSLIFVDWFTESTAFMLAHH